jgi:HAE1 family hydrophobic/amphiphilic exporter-1
VAYRGGSPVRIGDIGKVFDSVEDDKVASWFITPSTSDRAIILAVQRQPGTNTVEVADAIKKLVPEFRAQMPGSINLDVLYDRSQSIRESIEDVQFTLYLSMGLVVMVIFLFLRNFSTCTVDSALCHAASLKSMSPSLNHLTCSRFLLSAVRDARATEPH